MSDLISNGIKWYMDCELFLLMEADLNYLKTQVPKKYVPLEIRPQIGLIGIGVQNFTNGNLNGQLPIFQEITFQIMIQPDFSLNFPTPKFALFAKSISSNNREFLDYASEVDKMPCYYSNSIEIDIDIDSFAVNAHDKQGNIFKLKATPINPVYVQGKLFVQPFSFINGKHYFIPFAWEGLLYEHQKGINDLVLYQHPFFGDFDVKKISNQCYLAMNSPGDIVLTFYPSIEYKRGR